MKVTTIKDERRFRIFSLAVMAVIAILCIIPFILMLSSSFMSESEIALRGYSFLPKELCLDAYDYLWKKRYTIGACYGLSIFVTVFGTLANLAITALCAYPLSRQDFKYRNLFAFLIFFTLLFNGGMTASYIVWTRIFNIKNTIWALLLPNALVNAMNILIVRNYYVSNIPYSLIEAAKMDGASEMRVFVQIVCPLSVPVFATVGLFASINYWNNWINGMYYITDSKLYTITIYLNKILTDLSALRGGSMMAEQALLANTSMPASSVRMAVPIIAVLPILLIYPFVQKQLIKGLVVGAVKG